MIVLGTLFVGGLNVRLALEAATGLEMASAAPRAMKSVVLSFIVISSRN
jgi:hypothetical protein